MSTSARIFQAPPQSALLVSFIISTFLHSSFFRVLYLFFFSFVACGVGGWSGCATDSKRYIFYGMCSRTQSLALQSSRSWEASRLNPFNLCFNRAPHNVGQKHCRSCGIFFMQGRHCQSRGLDSGISVNASLGL